MGKKSKKKGTDAAGGDAPAVFKVEKLNEGEGEVCTKGSFVICHYHGTLADGTVFDSSVARNKPFEFQVGMGQVIRGWDEGITQLRKGQKAKLTCPPKYAYGEAGAGGVIPPNATLTFDVELLDFYQGVKVSHILYKHADCSKPYLPHKGNKPITRTLKEAKEGVAAIRKSIVEGQDFGKCALLFSDCASSANQGSLGLIGKGMMEPNFENKAFSMKVGDMSDMIETKFGFHILKRVETTHEDFLPKPPPKPVVGGCCKKC